MSSEATFYPVIRESSELVYTSADEREATGKGGGEDVFRVCAWSGEDLSWDKGSSDVFCPFR